MIIEIDELQNIEAINYADLITKVKNVMNSWQNRNLTLLGKIEITNTMVASMLVYKMQFLPMLSIQLEKNLQKLITNFIWNGKKPKIRLKTLTLNKCDGGRRLVNLKLRDASLKIEWVKRVAEGEDQILRSLAFYLINTQIQNDIFWECNFSPADVQQFRSHSKFWEDVLIVWSKYNYHVPETEAEISEQVLWYNSHIKINGNMLYNEKLYQTGIIYVKDLFWDNKFPTYEEFCRIYTPIPVMEYNSLQHSIPKKWKLIFTQDRSMGEQESTCSKFGILTAYPKWARIVYSSLNETDKILKHLAVHWEKILRDSVDTDKMKRSFIDINKTTDIVKYRSFQYRLLHNAVLCGDRLYHMNIVPENKCHYCKVEKETVLHLMWFCPKIQKVWKDLSDYVSSVDPSQQINFSASCIMLGNTTTPPENFVNLIVIVTKQMVYAKRCLKEKLNVKQIIGEIEFIQEKDKAKTYSTGNVKRYNKCWPDKISNDDNNTTREYIETNM